MSPQPPRLGAGRKLAYTLVFTLVLFAVVEVVLRLATRTLGEATLPGEQVRAHVETEALDYHPVYGWIRADLPDPGHHIDEHQFRRVTPIARAKPPNTWRAFTFGDSQTYGAGLHASETYSAVAEDVLQEAAPDVNVEIVNTGTSGYGSLQALRLIRYKVPAFEPDLYIVDNHPRDQPRDEVVPLEQQATAVERALFRWRTYYVVRFLVERARGRTRPMQADHDGGSGIHAGNHDSIMHLAAQQGVPVVFLDYPFWDMHRGRGSDAITCLAPAHALPPGATLISICEALKQDGRGGAELFLDNNHMSAAGAEVAGRALAAGLQELGLAP